jgi:aspartate 1-decarboxylase
MLVRMLKAKIHRATVTEANLEYEGSVTIDSKLLELAGILPYEAVDVYSVTSGSRLTTYTIPAPRGSGTVCINGAAAHLIKKGERVILCAYIHMEAEEAAAYHPTVVLVDEANSPRNVFHYGRSGGCQSHPPNN